MSIEALPRSDVHTSEPLRTERLIDHFPIMADVLEGMEDSVFLVRADDSPAGTFKDRGPGEKIEMLIQEGVGHIGVASAGNHLLGSIQRAAPLGVKFTGVLPATAPPEKREGAKKLWVECGGNPKDLSLHTIGSTYDDAYNYLVQEFPELSIIHAYDDPVVIDGRMSLAQDIAFALPQVTHTVSATGGGSLLAALTAGFHKQGLPVTTFGVEATGSDSLSRTLASGSEIPVTASNPNRRYGGLCVEKVGHHAVKRLVEYGFTHDRLTRADDADVRRLVESYRAYDTDYMEPSSVVAVAGLINLINQQRFSDGNTVAVIASGRNEHPHRLLQFPEQRRIRVASAQVLRQCQ